MLTVIFFFSQVFLWVMIQQTLIGMLGLFFMEKFSKVTFVGFAGRKIKLMGHSIEKLVWILKYDYIENIIIKFEIILKLQRYFS